MAAVSPELVEYRIFMPCSVAEYKIGQIYMVARHCHQQSQASEGVRVMLNEPYQSPEFGPGRYCEKRLYLGNRLASWINRMLPGGGIYVLEKSYNHYPYTLTEYSCPLLSRFNIRVDTRYTDGLEEVDNLFNLSQEELHRRRLVYIDIALDPLDPRKYRPDEDVTLLTSPTGRLPLERDWRQRCERIMCSYKLVRASFPVWGLQARAESYLHELIRQLLLHGHRQATAWMDDWLGLTEEEARSIERRMNEETNRRVDGGDCGGSS